MLASSSTANEPIIRSGPARLRLGLAAYSFRDYFSFSRGKPQTPRKDGPAMKMVDFLDYCTQHGVEAAELTSYFFDTNADSDYFRKLKREAFLRGVTISGTAIGNNFTVGRGERLDQEIESAKTWIRHARELGAGHIRFFAGTGREVEKEPHRIEEAIEALQECSKVAAEHGIILGVENHGNLTADQMLTIMKKVDSPWVGMNLDTGNFFSDNAYADLVTCAPYAVNVQVKLFMKKPDRTKYAADLPRIGGILKDSGYQGFVVLEYEEDNPYEDIPAAIEQLREAIA